MTDAQHMKYRPDIDGLRSLAVIPVVLFHAGVSALPGGFVGVDIFFVISGYLITGIILKNLALGSFSVTDFYKRRIKRIFPSLLIVIVTTLTIGAWILPPDRLEELARASIASILFISNFHFWKSVDYFATNTHVEPLLHMWSLAVEEQFYIFYPWLLILAVRFALPLRTLLAVVFAASLAISELAVEFAPSAAFYLLPTRAWELALGGILALNWIPPPSRMRSANSAGISGVLLILFSVLMYTNDTPFPGLAALPPTLGTGLIIWSGRYENSLVAVALSNPIPVRIGRASYSFYLWHLPLLAFATYLHGGVLPLSVGLTLSLIALALAFLTLEFVEDPVRRSSKRIAYMLPSALMAGLLIIPLGISKFQGIPGRFPRDVQMLLDTAKDKRRHHSECMSNGDKIVPPEEPCILGDLNAVPTVLLWGDSHAMVTATAMELTAKRAHRSFQFVAAADCPPGLDFSISEAFATNLTRTPSYRFCGDYNRRMLALALEQPEIQKIVLSSRWSNWRLGQPANPAEANPDIRLEHSGFVAKNSEGNAKIFRRGFLLLVERLRQAGKEVYIVGPLPEPDYDVPQRLYISRYGAIEPPEPIKSNDFASRHQVALRLIDQAAKMYGARIISPGALLCHDEICPIIQEGHPIFFDHNHLSIYGALLTAPLYTEVFR